MYVWQTKMLRLRLLKLVIPKYNVQLGTFAKRAKMELESQKELSVY
jgi:hypothetical protein